MSAGIELGEERLEQMLEGLRLETDATVGDANPGFVAVVKLGGQLDLALVRRELDGVGQQVDEHGADLVGIDLEGAQVSGHGKVEMELSCVDERTDLIDHVLDQATQLHRATLEGTSEILSSQQCQHARDQT